jgi:hypothetical protein
MTLKEIGHRLGVTREWVRRIEVRSLQKLGDDAIEAESTPVARPPAHRPRRRHAVLQTA